MDKKAIFIAGLFALILVIPAISYGIHSGTLVNLSNSNISITFNPHGCIHLHNAVLDDYSVGVHCTGGRPCNDFSRNIEYRAMTGTGKSLFFIIPWKCTPKVGTFTGKSKEAAILQPAKIKFTPNKGSDGIKRETVRMARNHQRV